jgi:hypothetical protein
MKIIRFFNPRTILFASLIALFATPQLIFASPLGVVDDPNTVVLLHMDGAEGSSQFSDESGKVWVAIGTPRITSSTARFGQSLELGNGDSILALDTDDLYFADGDFTIDFWVMFTSPVGSGETAAVFSQEQDSNNLMNITRSSTTWDFTVTSAGVELISLTGMANPNSSLWTHIAVVRDGDTFRLFENGTQIGSVIDTDSLPNFAAPLYIGSSAAPLHGNLDEFRISRVARWTSNFTPSGAPYTAPAPTPTSTATQTATPTFTPSVTSTSTLATSTPIPGSIIVITVPAVITINDTNANANTNTGSGSGSGSSGASGSSAGGFYALTPVAWPGQGGVAVFGGLSCGGYYIRARVYVDDNQDKMMSPAEGITGLQVFFLDQTYARLGSTYTQEGKAEFCIPVTHYGKTILIDIPYLQLFGTIQVPEQPNQDLEIWFPGNPPNLPLFLP